MPLDLADDKSTLVQVMAWCRQATSHYLNQCWPRSMSPYAVIRPLWVKRGRLSMMTVEVPVSQVSQGCWRHQHQSICTLWGESTSDWWIPLTKGQQHGKHFHVMMSSWKHFAVGSSPRCFHWNRPQGPVASEIYLKPKSHKTSSAYISFLCKWIFQKFRTDHGIIINVPCSNFVKDSLIALNVMSNKSFYNMWVFKMDFG